MSTPLSLEEEVVGDTMTVKTWLFNQENFAMQLRLWVGSRDYRDGGGGKEVMEIRIWSTETGKGVQETYGDK